MTLHRVVAVVMGLVTSLGILVAVEPEQPTSAAGSSFTGIVPSRVFETRSGKFTVDGQQQAVGRRPAGGVAQVQVGGRAGVPTNAEAVVVNVTAIRPDTNGYVTAFPCGADRPDASTLNHYPQAVVANGATIKLGTGGKICIYTHRATDLIVDVTGYYPARDPKPIVDRSATKVLANAAAKWTKFESVDSNAGSIGGLSAASLDAPAITFRSEGVVGLALPELDTGSGLLAVAENGIATDALATGSAAIQDFYSAPNGRFYVVFETPVPLASGANPCLLAEVESSTGIPSCVDDDLASIDWNELQSNGPRNAPIQFDDAGAIYYSGQSQSGRSVLRRYHSGNRTDLINDNIEIRTFLVLADGTVILSGQTWSTSAEWVRRLSAIGGLKTLSSGSSASFVDFFADGRPYMGLPGTNSNGNTEGIKRYLTALDSLEAKYWIANSEGTDARDAYFPSADLCDDSPADISSFCGWSGYLISDLISDIAGSTFAIAGPPGNPGNVLMKYYPTVEKANSIVTATTMIEQAGSSIFQAGTNSEGNNVLTLYNTLNRQETVLVDAQNEIEFYSMTFVESTNSLMFSGLRFADNKIVVGEIDLG